MDIALHGMAWQPIDRINVRTVIIRKNSTLLHRMYIRYFVMSIARFRSRFRCKRIHTLALCLASLCFAFLSYLCLLVSLCAHIKLSSSISIWMKTVVLFAFFARACLCIRVCLCACYIVCTVHIYEFMAVYRNNSSRQRTTFCLCIRHQNELKPGASMKHLFLALGTFRIFRLYIMISSDGSSYVSLIVKSLL